MSIFSIDFIPESTTNNKYTTLINQMNQAYKIASTNPSRRKCKDKARLDSKGPLGAVLKKGDP